MSDDGHGASGGPEAELGAAVLGSAASVSLASVYQLAAQATGQSMLGQVAAQQGMHQLSTAVVASAVQRMLAPANVPPPAAAPVLAPAPPAPPADPTVRAELDALKAELAETRATLQALVAALTERT
jgi:hypothetical protein